MIKIGILGAARIAADSIISPAARRDDCKIQVIACRDPERGKAFATRHNIPSVETSYAALTRRDDVDLVYNALPPSRHADMSIAALKAGKPVLCEKPFAMNADEARQMVCVSSRSSLPLIEAFHYRFHPAFARALDIIRTGGIGRVTHIDALFFAPVAFREGEIRHTLALGGGSLMDMGCYPLHWSRMIMRREPKVIRAECLTHRPNVDITAKAQLIFDNGVIANIECSMDVDRPFHAELCVLGTRGKLHFDNPLAPHRGHMLTVECDNNSFTETIDGGSTYDFQLAHMVDVIQGRASPQGGGDDSVANMVLIDAIYRAAGLPLR